MTAEEHGLFFDTSALVKYFRQEAGSERVSALIDDPRSTVCISTLAQVEFVSAVHRMYREDVLSDEQLQQALSGFQESVPAFQVEPLGGSVIDRAERLLRKHGRTRALRTLDALHLATLSLLDRTVSDKSLMTLQTSDLSHSEERSDEESLRWTAETILIGLHSRDVSALFGEIPRFARNDALDRRELPAL